MVRTTVHRHNDYSRRTPYEPASDPRYARPSRAGYVWVALLAFAGGAGFGAGAVNSERARTVELYELKAEEARQLKSEAIHLRTELAVQRGRSE